MTSNSERCRLRLEPPLECKGSCINHEKKAFISHARKDKEIARKLAKACCNGGVAPFLFEFAPASFMPSIDNAKVIADEVHESDIVLTLLGPKVSKFWTQAWMGFEIGVSLGADVALNRTIYNGYFSKRVFVLQDIRQGIEAAVPRLDALLLFDFSSKESWKKFQEGIRALTNLYLYEKETKEWPYARPASDVQIAQGELDFKPLNTLRSYLMTGRAICGEASCKGKYDVWITKEDLNLLEGRIEWSSELEATCSIECPSCENKELDLTLTRSL